jgi:hypothetical protein
MRYSANLSVGAGIGLAWMRRACATIAAGALVASPALAQSTIRTLTSPVEYTPFDVIVTTSKRTCFDPKFPLLGDVQYATGQLTVVLTHLNSPLDNLSAGILCGFDRRFTLPGLPRGRQNVRIDVTERSFQQSVGATISETITANIDVSPLNATTPLVNIWTGTFTTPPGTEVMRSFELTAGRVPFLNNTQWDWLEVGDIQQNYTFKALQTFITDRPPDALVRLYTVTYPDRYRGTLWTTDKTEAQRLAQLWQRTVSETPWLVGRLTNGACVIGMSPVYRTFHPQAVTHRWTQSRAAYAALLANGYSGDGAVWCAPALRGE